MESRYEVYAEEKGKDINYVFTRLDDSGKIMPETKISSGNSLEDLAVELTKLLPSPGELGYVLGIQSKADLSVDFFEGQESVFSRPLSIEETRKLYKKLKSRIRA